MLLLHHLLLLNFHFHNFVFSYFVCFYLKVESGGVLRIILISVFTIIITVPVRTVDLTWFETRKHYQVFLFT